MQIIVATRNRDKLKEIGKILEGSDIQICSLLDTSTAPNPPLQGRVEAPLSINTEHTAGFSPRSRGIDFSNIPDVIEDGRTFLENAKKKADAARAESGLWALADDSGLVVDALGGAPGVISARYAGRQGDYAANNRKLLEEMKNVPEGGRGAAFVCAMVLAAPDGREWFVEGRCEGVIARKPAGDGGFGYDPLFFIPEESKTMAELPMARKNEISHRGRALLKIKEILVAIGKRDE